ncbi:DUF4097 family beta strand repeat-containing protein [Spirillospora sp. CA-255316]
MNNQTGPHHDHHGADAGVPPRTLAAGRPGPVLLAVELPDGQVSVTAEPGRTVAEVTVSAVGADAAVAGAVRAAALHWDESLGALRVTVPEVTPAAGAAGMTIIGNEAATVVQRFGTIAAGASVTGVTITGGAVNFGGGTVVTGAAVVFGGVRVRALLPEGCRVHARTRSASLAAHGEFADIDAASLSGDVSVGGTGALHAETVSGDVRVGAVDGPAVVSTVSGDVRIGRGDDIRADTTSGDIAVADFGGIARLAAVSGDITVHAAEGGTIAARSVSGDITITATRAATAEGLSVEAHSQFGDVTTSDRAPAALAATRTRRPRGTRQD